MNRFFLKKINNVMSCGLINKYVDTEDLGTLRQEDIILNVFRCAYLMLKFIERC